MMLNSVITKIETITLKQLLPDVFKARPPIGSQVWNAELGLVQGKNYVLSADSGRGKSTFIHILYGLRSDYQGQVLIDEKFDSADFGVVQWANLRRYVFSIVFQDLRLLSDLSPMQNWILRAELFGKPDTELLLEMASSLSISHIINKPCGLLSYGERQRTAIIRALLAPFDWLLLDEPFSHLDATNTKAAQDLIEKMCGRYHAGFVATSLGQDEYKTQILPIFL